MSGFEELLALTLAADSAAQSGNLDEVNAILARRAEVLDGLESSGVRPTQNQIDQVHAAERGLQGRLESIKSTLVADSGDMRRARKAAIAYRASR